MSSTTSASTALPPVLRRKEQLSDQEDKSKKAQYRCSLINLDNTKDDELDAILGELSVLESQFESEIKGVDKQLDALESSQNKKGGSSSSSANSTSGNNSNDNSNSNGNSNSNNEKKGIVASPPVAVNNGNNEKPQPQQQKAGRTESPDNDSAFCDNLSMLSSCSASSSSARTDQSKSSSSGVSSAASPTSSEDAEARLKAEKIKLAIEKIKEASVKKLFVKVFTADGSAKSLLVDEKMSVAHVTRLLAEKNRVRLDPKWALVELVPDLYMERVYEDHECLVENCLLWKVDSKNTLWFIERPEKFDLFARPELYLLGSSSSQRGDAMEEHSRRELLEEYFSSSGVGAPEMEGFCWLKAESKKSWKRFYFVLRSSGLYYAPKGKKTSKDLVCLSTFDVNQVYYGAGWRKKYKSPTAYCFAIKHPQIQSKAPKYIRYLCVDTERELHRWVTGIRVAKCGRKMYDNYRAIEEEITHADIDILTSKRLSVNSPNSLAISSGNTSGNSNGNANGGSPARTPSSENKSLDSALSSGIISDVSCASPTPFPGIAEESSSENTPVNTMDRSHNHNSSRGGSLSRDSKSSSSSSSGCLSDRSSSGGPHGGFESDFPAGGTIKKRPAAANPRIPLTSTTWGLVGKDSDEENDDEGGACSGASSDVGGPNVRVGGGGTLLRSAVRQSHSRNNSTVGLQQQQQQRISNSSLESDEGTVKQHRVMAEVHRQPDEVDPLSAQFESSMTTSMEESLLPLPPPPRDESLDRLAASAVEDLPPPPPEIYEEVSNHHRCQPAPVVRSRPPPAPLGRVKPTPPLPPSLKRGGGSSSSAQSGNVGRRISFDDNVQLIGEASSTFMDLPRRSPLPPPCRLYAGAAPQSAAAPPASFLQDLQRVMNKKWQVAEKCRQDARATPHHVLGFRDEVQHLVDNGHVYDMDDSVGAWVLQTQQYRDEEPLYAVARKQHQHQQHANTPPAHYAPRPAQQQPQQQLPAQLPSSQPPVILREPEYDPYASLNPNGGCHANERADVANYSTVNLAAAVSAVQQNGFVATSSSSPSSSSSSSLLSPMRSSFRASPSPKKPPPPAPPRRSEHTQLTTTAKS